jgi:hypothetical protein
MPRLCEDAVEWRLVEGEVVAVDLRAGEYLAVNPSGAVLFPALAKGAARDELAALLTDRFDVAADAALADVDAFLGVLDQRGLVQWDE